MLRISFALTEEAALIERAVLNVLGSGLRTTDIMQSGYARVSTEIMGQSVVRELDKLVA